MAISNSREFLKKLKSDPEYFYIIHYSCQSLYDDNKDLSPSITSIAVTFFGTQQTVSFSTHAVAEELGIDRDSVAQKFSDIERNLLERFYDFACERRDKYWIHWNMRNLTYGFEHLEHRYRVLTKKSPCVIPVERRINLNDMLTDRYGSDYVSHDRMPNLMNLNGGIHKNFLSGPEEVEAFKNNEFIKLHSSTLCKIGFFHSVVNKLMRGKLCTNSKGWGVWLDRSFESRSAKMIGPIGSITGIIMAIDFMRRYVAL